jgi:hypothetical protein
MEFEKAALLRDRIIELRREYEFVDIARGVGGDGRKREKE